MRCYDQAIAKEALVQPHFQHAAHGGIHLQKPVFPPSAAQNAGRTAIDDALPNDFVLDNVTTIPKSIIGLSHRDYQKFTNAAHTAHFNPIEFAEWAMNQGVTANVTEKELFAFMEGGIYMRTLPQRQALMNEGITQDLADVIARYPTMAHLLSDIKILSNDILDLKGGTTVRYRPYNAAPAYKSLYSNGFLQYAFRNMPQGAAGLQPMGPGEMLGMELLDDYRALGGTPQKYIDCLTFYVANPALLTTVISAVIRGSSYQERNFLMIKAKTKKTLKEYSDTTTFERVAVPNVKIVTREYYSGLMKTPAMEGNDPLPKNVPLGAVKMVLDAAIETPYTNTEREHTVNIQTHAVTMNPNVDSRGYYLSPFARRRRNQAIVGVFGTQMDDYEADRRMNTIPNSIPNAKTSGREGASIIMAPSPCPIADATLRQGGNAQQVLPAMRTYSTTAQVPIRCFSIFDQENGYELLERRYAIPVIAPDAVELMPFEYESPRIRVTSLTL